MKLAARAARAALAALIALALPLPAQGAEGGAPGVSAMEKTSPAETAPKAAENFTWYCVQCHGPRGPRNLTDWKDMAQFSNADMERTITRGGGASDLSAIMPPWGNVFSQKEILDLVAHVRKLCKCRFDPKAKERAMREAGKLPEESPAPEKNDADPNKEKSP